MLSFRSIVAAPERATPRTFVVCRQEYAGNQQSLFVQSSPQFQGQEMYARGGGYLVVTLLRSKARENAIAHATSITVEMVM